MEYSLVPQPTFGIIMNLRLVPLLLAAFLCGCATITSSETQTVALSAKNGSGEALDAVECTLKNDKGEWKAIAPATVSIRRSAEDLDVVCKKTGMIDGMLKAISRAAGGMWGNIIFGGGIGAIIDHNKGTGYNYPDQLPVRMGESVVIDRKVQAEELARASTSGSK